MICKICKKNIDKGQKYQTVKYKSYNFCSKQCYDQFINTKENDTKSDYIKLTDYIQAIYQNNVNWPFISKQIKTYIEDYNLNYNQIRAILKYAIEYEQETINIEYGLGQFIPKYIDAFNIFYQTIQNNKKESAQWEDDIIIKKPIQNHCSYYWKEDSNF